MRQFQPPGLRCDVAAVPPLLGIRRQRKTVPGLVVAQQDPEDRCFITEHGLGNHAVHGQPDQVAVGEQRGQHGNGGQHEAHQQGHVVIEVQTADDHQRQQDAEPETKARRHHVNMPVFERVRQRGDAAAPADTLQDPAIESTGRLDGFAASDRVHGCQGMGTWSRSSFTWSSGSWLNPDGLRRCLASAGKDGLDVFGRDEIAVVEERMCATGRQQGQAGAR